MKAPFRSIVAAAALLTAAGVVGAAEAPAGDEPCQLRMYVSVDLPAGGVPLVPVTIDGKPGVMLLNPDSAMSALYENQLEKLGLQKKPLKAKSSKVEFGGKTVDSYVEIEAFGIGGTSFGRKGILVSPWKIRDLEGAPPILGTMGMDTFARMDVELDLARNKLNLFSQDHCKDMGAYWAKTFAEAPLHRGQLGELYFAVELEGRRIEATVAPDQPTTTLDLRVAKILFDFDETSPRTMKLTAPGLEVANTKIYLVDYVSDDCGRQTFGRKSGATGYIGCHGQHPIKLGRNILNELRLYFAIKEMKVYYTAANAGK